MSSRSIRTSVGTPAKHLLQVGGSSVMSMYTGLTQSASVFKDSAATSVPFGLNSFQCPLKHLANVFAQIVEVHQIMLHHHLEACRHAGAHTS